MSSSSTCSAQRAAANRANAKRSTGPRTPAGKRISSQNASTHHAYSADLLQPGESPILFHAHRDALLQRLCPMDALELCLAERVVSATWRLRRLQAADHFLALMEDADLRESVKDQNQTLEEFRQDNDDFDDNDPKLPPLPNPVELSPEPFTPAFLLARALRAPTDDPDHHRRSRAHTHTPFERLLTAEQRLQGLMHRALKELRQLQSDRRDHPNQETCPFLTTTNDDNDTDLREGEAPSEPRSTRGEAPENQLTSPTQSVPTPTTPSAQNEATCHNDSRTNHQTATPRTTDYGRPTPITAAINAVHFPSPQPPRS